MLGAVVINPRGMDFPVLHGSRRLLSSTDAHRQSLIQVTGTGSIGCDRRRAILKMTHAAL